MVAVTFPNYIYVGIKKSFGGLLYGSLLDLEKEQHEKNDPGGAPLTVTVGNIREQFRNPVLEVCSAAKTDKQ